MTFYHNLAKRLENKSLQDVPELKDLTQEQLTIIHKYLASRLNQPLHDGLHDNQKAVFISPAKRKAVVTGRRAGKTTLDARLLLQSIEKTMELEEDEARIAYCSVTRGYAKRLMWGRLQLVAKAQNIELEYNNTEQIAKAANGNEIWIMGLHDSRDIERLRGFSYLRVIIDECQGLYIDFTELVDEIIEPALADFDGDLIVSGTPNAACSGFFYEASNGHIPGWETFNWTVLDNPFFPRWRKADDWHKYAVDWLDSMRKSKGWDLDNPVYQREWLGKWIKDEGGLVYKYNSSKNGYIGEAPKGLNHVIGVDLGYDDAFSLVVWGFMPEVSPEVWQVDEYVKSGITISDWARVIKQFQHQYQPYATVADTGGLGKAIIKEMQIRHGMSIQAAEKTDKKDFIELWNSDAVAGLIHVIKGSRYERELELIQWDEDRKREDPRFPNDVADSGLYGFREAKHWLHVPRATIPSINSPDFADYEAKKMFINRVKGLKKRKKRRF